MTRLAETVTVERDVSRSRVGAIARELACDPALFQAVCARVAELAPDVTVPSIVTTMAERDWPGAAPGEAGDSGSVVSELVRECTSRRTAILVWVTLTTPAGFDPRPHLDVFDSSLGAWGVVEPRRDGSLHVHALALLDAESSPDALCSAWCSATGADPKAQRSRRVSGWQAFSRRGVEAALAENLGRIVRYCTKSPAGEGFARCAFAAVTLAGHSLLTVTSPVTPEPTMSESVTCACGCGELCASGSRYASPRHAARARQRRHRARVTPDGESPRSVSDVTPEPSASAGDVTPKRHCPPSVTSERNRELEAAAWGAVQIEGIESDCLSETLRGLFKGYPPPNARETDRALRRAIVRAT